MLKNDPDLLRERRQEYNRRYYRKNRQKIMQAHRRWRNRNPDYDRLYMLNKRKKVIA